jgi:hypothetical protein
LFRPFRVGVKTIPGVHVQLDFRRHMPVRLANVFAGAYRKRVTIVLLSMGIIGKTVLTLVTTSLKALIVGKGFVNSELRTCSVPRVHSELCNPTSHVQNVQILVKTMHKSTFLNRSALTASQIQKKSIIEQDPFFPKSR